MSPIRMSRVESTIRIALAFNEAFNRHDVAGMMQLMSEDCVFENTYPAPDGEAYAGKEAVTQFWQDFFRNSPHAHIEIEEIFGAGLRCIMRWRYTRDMCEGLISSRRRKASSARNCPTSRVSNDYQPSNLKGTFARMNSRS
jgi:hypothetical protein